MSSQDTYYSLPTTIGANKLAYALATNQSIDIDAMAIGDGLGVQVAPDASWTSLKREVYRAPLNNLSPHPTNANWLVAELVLPPEVGGFTIRELMLYDAAGDPIFVGNHPEQYKPQQSQGSEETKVIRMVIVVSSVSSVTLKTDPSTILVTMNRLQDKEVAGEGAGLVGYKGRTVQARLEEHPTPLDFKAIGDGLVNDSSAFTMLELAHQGRVIDLCGRTYVVDSIPNKNAYYNGVFKHSGYSRPASLADTFAAQAPKFHSFGGQLARLKAALVDPLVQKVGIVFIGDSITWGSGTGENMPTAPRDGTLSDPRDRFLSPSFVNAFKRYIGEQYAFGAAPALSNWPASPSGEAIAEYTVRNIVYPYGQPFALTSTGSTLAIDEQATGASLTGFQLRLQNGNQAGTSYHEISFNFTGDTFTFCFAVDPTGDGCNYELYVDNVLQGVYPTHRGLDGLTAGNDRRRVHTFAYVKNKQIRIRAIRLAGSTITNILRPEAIIVDKVIRITNQGINGATTVSYKTYNLAGNTFGDGVAVGPQDGFVFCQLGTNDRISTAARPKSVEYFKSNLGQVVDSVATASDVILMCANPAYNEDPATYFMNMQAVRGAIYRTAKERAIDMIDNYSIFAGLDIRAATSDGLHPNPLGARIMARNIINSIESA